MHKSLDLFLERLGKHIAAYGCWYGVPLIPPPGVTAVPLLPDPKTKATRGRIPWSQCRADRI